VYRKDRKTLIDKGGEVIIIMFKPTCDCEECPELHTACELKWIKLTTHKKYDVLVRIYYREPKSSLEQLDSFIAKIF
jgi:hypothetical protein